MKRRVIHKVILGMAVGTAVPLPKRLPKGFKIVHIADQAGWVTVWYEHRQVSRTPMVDAVFYVVGTGLEIPDGCTYQGTCVMHNGQLVAHVYMKDEDEHG